MHPIHRAGFAILIAAGWLVAPGRVSTTAGESGEIWVTAQNTSKLKILHGNGGIETVALPTGAEPHTITFSPDGSYAYVSNLGDGTLMVIRSDDRQTVATLNLGATWTHHAQPSPDGSTLLVANPVTGMLTKIAADEEAETWTPVSVLNLTAAARLGPVCVAFRPDGQRAYVSLFGPGIAVVDVATMTYIRTLPTIGGVACGFVNSKDGRTIFVDAAGGTGHFYRLDTATDTLTEDTGYGAIGLGIHGFVTTANEKRAYIASTMTEEVKVLDLNGSSVSTISLDPRPGVVDMPDSLARKGSNIYVTMRFGGQVARINTQNSSVDYIELTPPATSGWAVHGIAVRP